MRLNRQPTGAVRQTELSGKAMTVHRNEELRRELLAMAAEDERIRAELVKSGELFEGYAAEMEKLHCRNGLRLAEIIESHGWPGLGLVGEDGAQSAWLILMHAISMPSLLRRAAAVLQQAVERGEASAKQYAYLADRIRFFEGKPQIYGTQFDWDEKGELVPWVIEDPDRVDERRAKAGLPALEEQMSELRRRATIEGDSPPDDFAARKNDMEQWAIRAGWRG